MAMEYINYLKSKAGIGTTITADKPILSDEDEQFLTHITSAENPPPLPARPNHGGDAQLALLDGAHNVALPPATPNETTLTEEPSGLIEVQKDTTQEQEKHRKNWSWLRRDSRDARHQHQQTTADSLHDVAQGLKTTEAPAAEGAEEAEVDPEVKQEQEDMSVILEQLNLAAVNNRVFSISDETQELLVKFNQVLKDLMNGVPTAYNDLESLLSNSDRQLQKTFNGLPSFLQKLIEKLPETMTKGIAPEIMAAASERASKSGINLGKAGKAAGAASRFMKTPSLKDLVGKPTAITGMLRSIVTFLRARFPAFVGLNVLWSLALFVLLFVFWYCYKRGREVRLEKERELTEQELLQLEREWAATKKDDTEQRPSFSTTTAPPGAPLEQVKEGAEEAEAFKVAAALEAEETETIPTVPTASNTNRNASPTA